MQTKIASHLFSMTLPHPRFANSDYTGLLNFAEQLEAASKRFTGSYELEASTITNLRQIVKRLPGYLINKWGDASYAIREKGNDPKLSDLAKFVKRQAAIKNDPAFVNVSVDRSNLKGKQARQFDTKFTGSGPSKQTLSFATDMKSSIEKSASVKLNAKSNSEPDKTCHCCSGHHPLAECTEFRSKNLHLAGALLNKINCAMFVFKVVTCGSIVSV